MLPLEPLQRTEVYTKDHEDTPRGRKKSVLAAVDRRQDFVSRDPARLEGYLNIPSHLQDCLDGGWYRALTHSVMTDKNI